MTLRTSPTIARGRPFLAVLAVLALLGACNGNDDAPTTASPEATGPANGQDEPDEVTEPDEPEPTEEPEPAVDPAEVGANELGRIPVLMYHRILPDGGGDYDNTPEEFRDELRRLHEEGYVPITTAELVSGHIDVPAGTTPVVLTFDDSTREQFGLTEDGEVVPDTAVAIMEELAEELDGFEPAGSFYVLRSLFGSSEERGRELLAELHARGYEIGNHTADHDNLGQLDASGVQRALAEGVANITAAIPDAEVRTLSYPLGIRPDDPTLVAEGEHDGITYTHEAGLLVGSGPSPAPFDAEFDPLAIPRIRSQPDWTPGDEPDYSSGFWLAWFQDNPEQRYVSDGDSDTISFPEALADQLHPDLVDRARPY
ncbi:polysaccharide deacetylase family protein [Nitriliruptor alkaliphilus]|uniref:polysaccharide deacetylase family protein n=1 Tax=Nitriliruptor alkaliphilus TaxID=427918 RepID=UPI0006979523|nr:polysaccharide deacetylase family protein [Nitriliruptor alkaliphilus]